MSTTLLGWSRKHGDRINPQDPRQRFSLFVQVDEDHWLLARAVFMGDSDQGHAAALSGLILSRDNLEAVGWAAHRLLPFVPTIEEIGMRSPKGILKIDLTPPKYRRLREENIGQLPDGRDLQETQKKGYGKMTIVDDQMMLALGASEKDLKDFSPSEYGIGVCADQLLAQNRPRAWITTRLLPSTGRLAQKNIFENILWKYIHKAEIDPSIIPAPDSSRADAMRPGAVPRSGQTERARPS